MRLLGWLAFAGSLALTLIGAAPAAPGTAGTPDTAGGNSSVDWASCLVCHPDYADELPPLADLRPEGLGTVLRQSCFDCHSGSGMQPRVPGWLHKVRPVASPSHLSCTQCHPAVAHSAAAPPPLPRGDYREEACFACHSDVEAKLAGLNSHGDAAGLRCATCHPPHRAMPAALPLEFVPQASQSEWQALADPRRSNAGCVDCHPLPLLTTRRDAGFVTLNTMNYHDLHVIRSDILCVECHDPHGSNRDAMMRLRLITGELLSFRRSPAGASCAVTCHDVEHDNLPYVNRAQ